MPTFDYTAIKSDNNFVKGTLEASNLKEARNLLRAKKLTPTKVKEINIKVKEEKLSKPKTKRVPKLNLREKINFTTSINVLLKTGVSIVEALLFIEQNFESKKVQLLAEDLRRTVLGGKSISDAMAKHPKTFDHVYIGLVKSGEESGELDFTLARMKQLLDKQDKLIGKVKGVLFYPVFIIFLAMVVTTIMLTIVFPAFEDVFAQMGAELPFITRTLIDIGKFLKQYWFVIPLIFGMVALSGYVLITWHKSKRVIDMILLKIPLLRTFVTYLSLANFLSVMSISFEAGIPIVDCLILSNLTVKNVIIKEKFKETSIKVRQGRSFSASLKAMNIIPSIIMCMISTGEQSGQLGELMQMSGDYVDEQLEDTVDLLNKMLEPILLVVIGGIILVLALALYLPIFQSYGNIS